MTGGLWATRPIARILRVSRNSLMNWRAEGRLIPERTDMVRFLYHIDALTDFLFASARNFGDERVPTFNDLVDRRESLYTSHELMSLFGLTQSAITWHVANGNLPVFALGKNTWRFPATPIKRMLRAVPQDDVVRILGVSPRSIRDIVSANELETLHVLGQGTALFVTRESLRAYLAERLAESGVPPEIWWEDQLTYDDALLSARQVQERLEVNWSTLKELFASGRLPFIKTAGGYRLVPERYVQWIIDGRTGHRAPIRRTLADSHIAAAFGVAPQVAQRWVSNGQFCNGQHGECRAVTCVQQFIASHLTTTAFTVDQWLTWTSGSQMATLVDVGSMVDPSEPAVISALQDGRLRGVRSPDDRLRVIEADLQRFLRWYEHHVIGADYEYDEANPRQLWWYESHFLSTDYDYYDPDAF